jgi:cobalt-zinc-cadmium resistance protein CzcA
MSLGAIDFGFLVDGPIVMLEAVIARLALHDINPRSTARRSRRSVRQVAAGGVLGAIILLVYLPLLSLEGRGEDVPPDGRHHGLALGGSVVFALVVFPAGAVTFLRPAEEAGAPRAAAPPGGAVSRAVQWALEARAVGPLVDGRRALAATVPVAGPRRGLRPAHRRGRHRGGHPAHPEHRDLRGARLDLATERVLARFPEVVTSLAMTGRAEVATRPGRHGQHRHPRAPPAPKRVDHAHDLDALGELMKTAIEREVPSTFVSISQPIEDRTNELISGSRADVAIHLFGEDLR